MAPQVRPLKKAALGKTTNPKTGRLAQHFQCALCAKGYPSSEVQVDHIEPVISSQSGFISWDVFIERLFCEAENLQVLCKTCHADKTLKEKNERQKTKDSS
jgi:5-methylcytosine-specific restriction endonuclease McrA